MLTLIAACLLHSPAWVSELGMTPPPVASPQLKGPAEAPELVVAPSAKKTLLTVNGPGVVKVRAAALLKKKGAKYTAPGKLLIWIGSVQRRTLALPASPAPGWFVVGRNAWAVGELAELEVPLADGPQKISITHQQGGAGLYAVVVTVLPPPAAAVATAPPAAADPEPPLPPEPPPAPASPLATGPAVEDDVPALVEAPVEVPPPPLATAPQAPPGLQLPDRPRHQLLGPDGADDFFTAAIEPAFAFVATGPGQLLLDLHAHRRADRPETQSPIIFGVLLDDVLVQTVALDQSVDPRWRLADGDDELSARAVMRLSLPVGDHRVALSLSDNATRGISVRPRFLAAGAVEEPEVLDLGMARRGDLRPVDDRAPQLSATVSGGLWLPHAIQASGATAQLSLGWGLPLLGSRLWLELAGGFGQAHARRAVAVTDFPNGRAVLRLTTSAAPLVACATWSAPMPIDGLSVDVGLGGGVLFAWNGDRFAGAAEESGLRILPALAASGGLSFAVGPGAILLRAQMLTAVPWTVAAYREFESGSISLLTGYRLVID